LRASDQNTGLRYALDQCKQRAHPEMTKSGLIILPLDS
jgi:hypothetical protein